MNIHMVGGGGRAHVVTWKLARSPLVTGLTCAPGNAGIANEVLHNGRHVTCWSDVATTDIARQLELAKLIKPDLTIVSEDDPLALGIVDRFEQAGFAVWGPSRRASRFEWSKCFMQGFSVRHHLPIAPGKCFQLPSEARRYAKQLGWKGAFKADGLAQGKGVLICRNEQACRSAIEQMLVKGEFGPAGDSILIQHLQEGVEASLHFFCDGKIVLCFPSAKDHKALLDNGEGGMTGGMGVVSPSPDIPEDVFKAAALEIIGPWLNGCREEGIDFRGILYPGVMFKGKQATALEFNARFGDPETQAYLVRLQSDLVELVEASRTGTLHKVELQWGPAVSVCVVMTAAGYPGKPERGKVIRGLDEAEKIPNIKVFYGGTTRVGNDVFTNGGRVLYVTGWGEELVLVRRNVYSVVRDVISFEGAHYRRTIGGPPIV